MMTIKKPLKDLPLFLIVNYEEMLTGSFKKEFNVIILNSFEVEELIEQLSKDIDKSKRFQYWVGTHNSLKGIEGMFKLLEFFIANDFKYHITNEQLKMYHETVKGVDYI